VTTPGLVNLPAGALTPGTMASKLQDMSAEAMRGRAAARVPGIFNGSNGGDPLSDLSPTGLITRIFAEFNSAVANADPGDINGPEDLPDMLRAFLEGLPVVGEFVRLLSAILGEYEGEDEILIAIQAIFYPLRKLVQLVSGNDVGFPTGEEVTSGWVQLFDAIGDRIRELGQAIVDAFNGIPTAVEGLVTDVWNAISGILNIGQNAQQTADDGWSQIVGINAILVGVRVGVGTSGSDNFDGTVLTNPGPNYAVSTIGAATNKYYRDGNGLLKFQPHGFISNFCILARSDIQFIGYRTTVGVYLPKRISIWGGELILFNRYSHSLFEGYCARITRNTIQFGYLGTYLGAPTFFNLGSASTYSQADGEYWELDVGETDGSNDYMARVRRNGRQVHQFDDTAHTFAPTGAYLDIAVGGSSAVSLPTIIPAPTIDTLAWYERA